MTPTRRLLSRFAAPSTRTFATGFASAFAALVALLAGSHAPVASAAERPNILFIIYDDMNWDSAGVHGCEWIETPNLDRVACEGILFRLADAPRAEEFAPQRSDSLTLSASPASERT